MKGHIIIYMLLCASFIYGNDKPDEVLINNIFIEADLRQALMDISSQANVTIIPDPVVQGLVSAEIKEIPLEKCLEMILFPLGFTYKKVKDYYVVSSVNPKSPSFNLVSRTEKINLNYISAVDAVYNLPNFLRTYVKLNKEKNILTITAPDEFIQRIKKDITTLDIQPKQVLMEVIVTEVYSDTIKSLGMDWTDAIEAGADFTGEYIKGQGSIYKLTGDIANQALLTLKMLAQDGSINIRANPKILTEDTKEAIIDIITEKYVSLETGTEDRSFTRLQSVSAGIKLKIIPIIGENNHVALKVETEVSDILPGTSGDVKLSVNRRSASTSVRLDNGQTLCIGGLIQEKNESRISSIPVLGRIPLLGVLFFTFKRKVHQKSELVIFITPKII